MSSTMAVSLSLAFLASDSLFPFSPFSSVRGDQNTVQMLSFIFLYYIPFNYHIKNKFRSPFKTLPTNGPP